ncbi:MAG TPA: response regulator [Flavisolibacter sp.]|jgi:CheY-like chemotaxis protein
MKILSPQVTQIVLVDDDMEECFIVKTILHDLAPHITVTTLYDVDHVLEFLEHLLPDLLILDMSMPGKSGIDCLRTLKNDPVLRHLPVIVYSTSGHPVDICLAYDHGAALYVEKPEQYAELVQTLKAVLAYNWQEPGLVSSQRILDANIKAFKVPKPVQNRVD